jgi:hypothetical protein
MLNLNKNIYLLQVYLIIILNYLEINFMSILGVI